MFIGTVVDVILYGIMLTQTFLYFSNYKGCVRKPAINSHGLSLLYGFSDRLWMKTFVRDLDSGGILCHLIMIYGQVGLLFLADTLKSVFDLIYLYDSLIAHFGS